MYTSCWVIYVMVHLCANRGLGISNLWAHLLPLNVAFCTPSSTLSSPVLTFANSCRFPISLHLNQMFCIRAWLKPIRFLIDQFNMHTVISTPSGGDALRQCHRNRGIPKYSRQRLYEILSYCFPLLFLKDFESFWKYVAYSSNVASQFP